MSRFRAYSLAKVKSHNTRESAWIIINDSVYDVTEFLLKHPGGEEALLEQVGEDVSEEFEDVGHSTDARELMQQFKVGELIESERKKITIFAIEEEDSFLSSWFFPVMVASLVTLVYRMFFRD